MRVCTIFSHCDDTDSRRETLEGIQYEETPESEQEWTRISFLSSEFYLIPNTSYLVPTNEPLPSYRSRIYIYIHLSTQAQALLPSF